MTNYQINQIPFETTSLPQVIEKISRQSGGIILSLNPETFYLAMTDSFFKNLFQKSLINLPDGAGIVLAMRWLARKKIERLPGVELIEMLFEKNSGPYFFLGAKPDVLKKLAEVVSQKYAIQVCGMQDGYFKKEDENAVLDRIEKLSPKFILIAMGSPRQEILAEQLMKRCPGSFIIPCGGSFDVISLSTPRAPAFFRTFHLEWLYRLSRQPFRIKRSLPKLIWFFVSILQKKITITS